MKMIAFGSTALGLLMVINASRAALIDFEPPTYSVGLLSGQDGWGTFVSAGTSNSVVVSAASGIYAGGQAAGQTTSSSRQNSKLFDLYSGPDGNGYQFDIRSASAINAVFATTAGIDMPTPQFAPLVGINGNNFYVRAIGASDYTVTQGATGQFPGFQPTISGNWYHMIVTYDATANELHVTATNLTNGGSAVATGYETIANLLNTTTYATSAARQAFFDSMAYTTLRISNTGASIDNIENVVPEPMSLILTVIGMIGTVGLFRRGK